jgi:hypothetical protein
LRPVRINPARLLDAARELAASDRLGRPKTVWLRRAVSTAYYALFHFLTQELAKHLLPSGAAADQLRMTRSVGHDQLKDVCGWIRSSQTNLGPAHSQPLINSLHGTLIALKSSIM